MIHWKQVITNMTGSRRICELFASQQNAKVVATVKHFITGVKFCLLYFYYNALW